MTSYIASLAQACQRLWPVPIYGVYWLFTYVDHIIKPGTPTALTLAVVALTLRLRLSIIGGLRCPRSFIPRRCHLRMSW